MKIFFISIIFLVFSPNIFCKEVVEVGSCSDTSYNGTVEVRTVWLATNYGLDWPDEKENVEQQKKSLTAILDSLQSCKINMVFFQVRTRGELLYRSSIEPMNPLVAKARIGEEFFDPLLFAIEECHKRGLECHAWFVVYPMGKNLKGPKRVSFIRRFQGEWYIDPGHPHSIDYLLSLIHELVRGYDIDGIHLDYIRYPENGNNFPDTQLYRLYGKGKTREQWRRDNVTKLVIEIYNYVKSVKPWVQVSCAPIARYRIVNGKGWGWTAYEAVYQDVARWIKLGKMDAIYPMMYINDEHFPLFLKDWKEQSQNRILAPGLALYKMEEADWPLSDIVKQLNYIAAEGVSGVSLYRAEHLLSNTKGILNVLCENYFTHYAKLPPMSWLSDAVPVKPSDLRAEKWDDGMFHLFWEHRLSSDVTFTIYRSEEPEFDTDNAEKILITHFRETHFILDVKNNDKAYYYYVTASDRYHNESEPSIAAFFIHSDDIK